MGVSGRLSRRGCAGEAATVVGVDDEGNDAAGFGVPESALVGDAAVAEEAGEHGERGDRQGLIDVRFLRVDRRGSAATRQWVLFLVQHLREELGDGPQPLLTPTVA